MKDAVATMGTILTDEEGRDAVHIAVIAVVAKYRLEPGENVGKDGSKRNPIGIVDPFLKHTVKSGEKFWLFLYPRTITSLRHVWEHPAFPKEEEAPAAFVDKRASELWLRKFADTCDCPSYETLIKAVHGDNIADDDCDWASSKIDDEYFYFSGIDAHGEIPEEFWHHIEVVTGKKCKYKPPYFACSC